MFSSHIRWCQCIELTECTVVLLSIQGLFLKELYPLSSSLEEDLVSLFTSDHSPHNLGISAEIHVVYFLGIVFLRKTFISFFYYMALALFRGD